MAKKNQKTNSEETTIEVSSELTAKQLKKQERKQAKQNEFKTQSKFTKAFKYHVWPILLPFVVVMIFLVILPIFAVIVTSLMGYSDAETKADAQISIENYVATFRNQSIWISIGYSIGFAFAASVLCIIVGYPVAYIMSQLKSKILAKNAWVLVTMPMWISMLLKVLGLQTMFSLMSKTFIGTPICIIVGMMYMFIPFAIGPMYDSIVARDLAQEEAAMDLGCSRTKTFWTITLRNTLTGMLTGFSLVIVQAATSLIVVQYLGGGTKYSNLIAKIIESYFIKGGDWPQATAIAVVLTIIVFIIMAVIALLTKRARTQKKGKNKWKDSERVVISHS